MTEYRPGNVGTVTKYVVVDSFNITPADLAVRAYEVSQGVLIKETCFGIAIMGREEEVDLIITEIRKMDPEHIFVKDRGFPPGDPRRCRSNIGGSRPGFHGLEYEMGVIPYVSHALEVLNTQNTGTVKEPPPARGKKKLDIYTLKKMIDATEP